MKSHGGNLLMMMTTLCLDYDKYCGNGLVRDEYSILLGSINLVISIFIIILNCLKC